MMMMMMAAARSASLKLRFESDVFVVHKERMEGKRKKKQTYFSCFYTNLQFFSFLYFFPSFLSTEVYLNSQTT
jgi:hypothetical protein